MGLDSAVDVAFTSEADGRGFDARLDARFLSQHVDPQINWVLTWLWSIVELSGIERYISLQYYYY